MDLMRMLKNKSLKISNKDLTLNSSSGFVAKLTITATSNETLKSIAAKYM